MKIGREVEGRLKGVLTLFVDAKELDKIAVVTQHYNQLYVSVPLGEEVSLNFDYLSKLAEKVIVTVEMSQIVFDIPEWMNVVLNVESPHFWRLKNTDQVKFHDGKLSICTATIENMCHTFPFQFEDDLKL